ncbi:MAG: hypothetical protein JXR91_14585 [Deltaproteobacteria bacterium]|nr:hypothetical protein [Deltaproteobacteria bacterium]
MGYNKLVIFYFALFLLIVFNSSVFAQDDMAGGDSINDDEIPAQAPAVDESATPAKDAEIIKDKEDANIERQASGFLSVGGTGIWLKRNGLGATLSVGGLTCYRDYCDTTLDVKIFGSAAGTIGAYYKINPNLSVFGNSTFAYVNTNWSQLSTGSANTSKEGAFEWQFIVGAAFHLPVKGWLDLNASAGIGPILLRAKATATNGLEYYHHWAGIDFELGLGADFYFWSVGFAKNLSIGPYMRMGFPIWLRVCAVANGNNDEVCDLPSNQPDNTVQSWKSTPMTFSTGFEVKYDFGIVFGNTTQSEPAPEPAPAKDKPAAKAETNDEAASDGESEASVSADASLGF